MGTWSYKPFGNDTAKDWIWSLANSSSDESVTLAINDALDTGDVLDATTSEKAVAAASTIAAATLDPVRGVPKDVAGWIRTSGYVPTKNRIRDATRVLDLILGESELRDLWDEAGSSKGWLKSLREVRQCLVDAVSSELPSRVPRKPGMPRLLYRLIERYSQDPCESVRQKIREKIDALEDVEEVSADTQREKPLILVAAVGLLEETRSLLERGADPNQSSSYTGKRAVVVACKSGNVEMLKLMLDSGADLFAEQTKFDEDGSDVVHRYVPAFVGALYFGTPDMLEMLESRGVPIDQLGINGETPLYEASYLGNFAVVDYLLKRGFDPNDSGEYSETPIFTAVRGGHYEIVERLVDAGADVNLQELRGSRPIDYAVKGESIADLLVKHGAVPGAPLTGKHFDANGNS